MPNNAARRRAERARADELLERTRNAGVTGVFTETGFADAGSMGVLPAKVAGRHRWLATAAYSLTEAMVANELAQRRGEPGPASILDHETRMALCVGCWDCEAEIGTAPGQVTPSTVCPAAGEDS